jgi:hypothetical protein
MIKVEWLAVGGLVIPSRVGLVNDQIYASVEFANCSSQLEKQGLLL